MDGQDRINELFAFVVIDADGTEGVPAFESNGVLHPMVGADLARAEALLPMARRAARELGRPVTLLRFTVREQLRVIPP